MYLASLSISILTIALMLATTRSNVQIMGKNINLMTMNIKPSLSKDVLILLLSDVISQSMCVSDIVKIA